MLTLLCKLRRRKASLKARTFVSDDRKACDGDARGRESEEQQRDARRQLRDADGRDATAGPAGLHGRAASFYETREGLRQARCVQTGVWSFRKFGECKEK